MLLMDMGEWERARVLIESLLAQESLTDPHEIRFLTGKLRELEGK